MSSLAGLPARRRTLRAAAALIVGLVGAGCSSKAGSPASGGAATTASSATRAGTVNAVGAENEYANVIGQIGGSYVKVTAIMSDPNTDPHTFEASPSVATAVAAASLIVQNGLGYDDFMQKIESASPDPGRKVIDVQTLLGLTDSTPNPHLWYSPTTMPAVANALASDLGALLPAHAGYFQANAATFIASLQPWRDAIAAFKSAYPAAPVATTEPVGDYLLQAAGTDDLTPFGLQADIMNGVDPAPQDLTTQDDLLAEHRVKVLVYNEQVTDSVTNTFLTLARKHGVPVVGVYETMPTPGYDYQTWMLAETEALQKAVGQHLSTEKLS